MDHTKQEKKAAITNILKPYLKMGEMDELTACHKELATYYAPITPASFNDTGDVFQCTALIVKELDEQRIPVYTALSENWNPYLETVFGFLHVDGTVYSVNEFVHPPAFLESYTNKISLTLEEYIEQNHKTKPLSETEALIFLYELCEGLKDLHKKELFHGDISPQNILLTDAGCFTDPRFRSLDGIHRHVSLKIIDFGSAKAYKSSNHEVTTAVGTKLYAAPDILDFHHPVDQRADLYSLGCILGFLLTGTSPKEANLQPQVSKKIWKIIEKCTATYYERFANVSQLQRCILRELNHSSTVVENVIRSIPGFRSHNYTKMAIGGYFHFAFLFGSICMSIAGLFRKAAVVLLLYLISVISLFDVFHCMEYLQRHCYFLRKHNTLALVIRITVALAIIYGACTLLERYL